MVALLPALDALRVESHGLLTDVGTTTLLGLMGGSIGYLALHRDEFEAYEDEREEYEEGYYKRVQDVLISSLAQGLMVEE